MKDGIAENAIDPLGGVIQFDLTSPSRRGTDRDDRDCPEDVPGGEGPKPPAPSVPRQQLRHSRADGGAEWQRGLTFDREEKARRESSPGLVAVSGGW